MCNKIGSSERMYGVIHYPFVAFIAVALTSAHSYTHTRTEQVYRGASRGRFKFNCISVAALHARPRLFIRKIKALMSN